MKTYSDSERLAFLLTELSMSVQDLDGVMYKYDFLKTLVQTGEFNPIHETKAIEL